MAKFSRYFNKMFVAYGSSSVVNWKKKKKKNQLMYVITIYPNLFRYLSLISRNRVGDY